MHRPTLIKCSPPRNVKIVPTPLVLHVRPSVSDGLLTRKQNGVEKPNSVLAYHGAGVTAVCQF